MKLGRLVPLGRRPLWAAAIAVSITALVWAGARFSSAPVTESADRTLPSGRSGYRVENEYLYRVQSLFQPTLEANRKEFTGRLGSVRGFGAGEVYPQVWLRDSSTIIPASRFYYSLDYLTSWLEEHLGHQGNDGQLYDWIAAGPPSHFVRYAPRAKQIYQNGPSFQLSADKNTTESDQESSAVAAAYQIYQITGDRDWLTKKLRGKSILERLDASLEYLIRERFDARYGLILSAFTADWGDVSPLYPDQRAIYLDPQTPQVVGLYTNCQFYRAANQLSEMLRSLDQNSRADYWRLKASATKANMNRHLWQEDRGFYRMHLAVTPDRVRGWPDDSNIFATGGNGLAVLYEIADAGKIRSIFHIAQELSRTLGISSVSGALLPPYPRGFFKYPSMKEEYSYQNGGQWDWFGGRFVLAEFERGYAEPAHRHLVEIARKVVLGGGLYEWHTKEGRGRGSPRYSGSAGAVAAACFQGLFGVYLRASGLELKVRLGSLSGQIQLHQPATDTFVRYRYRYDAQAGRVTMRYESNASSEGSLSILVPKSSTVAELWLDGEERSFSVETVGQDQYVKVSTDWSPHELRLQFE